MKKFLAFVSLVAVAVACGGKNPDVDITNFQPTPGNTATPDAGPPPVIDSGTLEIDAGDTDPPDPVIPGCNYKYTDYGDCQPDGTKIRKVQEVNQGCTVAPSLIAPCVFIPSITDAGINESDAGNAPPVATCSTPGFTCGSCTDGNGKYGSYGDCSSDKVCDNYSSGGNCTSYESLCNAGNKEDFVGACTANTAQINTTDCSFVVNKVSITETWNNTTIPGSSIGCDTDSMYTYNCNGHVISFHKFEWNTDIPDHTGATVGVQLGTVIPTSNRTSCGKSVIWYYTDRAAVINSFNHDDKLSFTEVNFIAL